MTTITILDASSNPQTLTVPNANGRAADAGSAPVALSNEDVALFTTLHNDLTTAVPDRSATATLDLTTLNATTAPLVVAGMGTINVQLGSTGASGTALGSAGVVAFERLMIVSGDWVATNAYPVITGFPVFTAAVCGTWLIDAEGASAIRLRTSVVGTGTLAVSFGISALPRVQATAPVWNGQTTRKYNRALSQHLTTTTADQQITIPACREIMVQCVGARGWYNLDAVASATANGSTPIEPGDRFHEQVSAGQILHYIWDTVAGGLIVTPVA